MNLETGDITAKRHKGSETSNAAHEKVVQVCNRCKRQMPVTTQYFGINNAALSGFKATCKKCEHDARDLKEYGYAATPEKKLEHDVQQFWAKVDTSGQCWMWNGRISDDHYGRFSSRCFSRRFRAHRFSWFLEHGEFPPSDLAVCHSCDTPLCVNPKHLWLGTLSENSKDMWNKGRARPQAHKGEANGRSKLTDDLVLIMREEYATGLTSFPKLGRKYDVSVTTAHRAVKGIYWAHLSSEAKALGILEETKDAPRAGCKVLRVAKFA